MKEAIFFIRAPAVGQHYCFENRLGVLQYPAPARDEVDPRALQILHILKEQKRYASHHTDSTNHQSTENSSFHCPNDCPHALTPVCPTCPILRLTSTIGRPRKTYTSAALHVRSSGKCTSKHTHTDLNAHSATKTKWRNARTHDTRISNNARTTASCPRHA